VALSQAEFDDLVDQHGAALYRTAVRLVGNRHDAEDLVQEAFRSAWKSRQNYQPGRGDRAWLASILRRRAIDSWRKKRPVRLMTSDSPPEVPVEGEDPIEQGFTDEMQAALDQLPDSLRETLLLVVVAELTHQEVSDLLDIPLGTVLSRVSRARSRLRSLLVAEAKA